ncbi:helix-turn-helix transcriptional regulator, partial [Parapedobacter sp. ISTM3]|uniref:helix-turn-helix domain-containing protein n=1 Tax=Parapedobacter sp. ISTM3 TaxID=2800130 RepID=UPI001908FDF8
NTGEKITALRKEKKMSQEDLATAAGVSREMVGKYERGDALPSIEVARRIADKLDVSLDYLSGKTDDQLDARTLDRVPEVQKLPEDIREKLFYFIDMSIRDSKAKQAYAQ